jgi:hypothetical protein
MVTISCNDSIYYSVWRKWGNDDPFKGKERTGRHQFLLSIFSILKYWNRNMGAKCASKVRKPGAAGKKCAFGREKRGINKMEKLGNQGGRE